MTLSQNSRLQEVKDKADIEVKLITDSSMDWNLMVGSVDLVVKCSQIYLNLQLDLGY
jgi:hypothetical protein